MFDTRLAGIRTAVPAKVTAFRTEGGQALVDVEVGILGIDIDTRETDDPLILKNVPVVYPRGKRWGITWKIVPGDCVLLVVCDRDITAWISGNGDPKPPVEYRHHELSDCVAIPGLFPSSVPDPPEGEGLVVRYDQAKLRFANGKIALGNQAGELLDLFDQLISTLQTATVSTALGPQPLDPATQATLTQLKTTLSLMKGSL
jgi:hypothetical protein